MRFASSKGCEPDQPKKSVVHLQRQYFANGMALTVKVPETNGAACKLWALLAKRDPPTAPHRPLGGAHCIVLS